MAHMSIVTINLSYRHCFNFFRSRYLQRHGLQRILIMCLCILQRIVAIQREALVHFVGVGGVSFRFILRVSQFQRILNLLIQIFETNVSFLTIFYKLRFLIFFLALRLILDLIN